MAGRQQRTLMLTGLRGRDGHATADVDVPMDKARECRNVDFYRTSYARKRGGALAQLLTGSGLTGYLSSAHRHVPGADDTQAELWLVDQTAAGGCNLARGTGGNYAPVAWKSAIEHGYQWHVRWVSFNGKLYILGNSSVDRLQVFDPTTSTTALRYAGFSQPPPPTPSNHLTGTYPATTRYYRSVYTTQVSGSTVRRSNASTTVAFTPSGSAMGVLVTCGAMLGEGETHWELYGAASENGPFYLLWTVPAVNGTNGGDFELPSDYYKHITLMPLQGDHTPPWSAKYGITDDNRLLLAGANEPGHSQNEVWFTPVLGSTSPLFADDERLPATNKISFTERDSGYITGLGGPIGNTVMVFKNTQTWRLIPTGIEADPYRRRMVSRAVGCLSQTSVVLAEDQLGTPTLYWLSAQGPYRFNLATGLARLTWDVQDIWDTVNVNAAVPPHGVAVPDKHQIWWYVPVGTETEPQSLKLAYDTHLGRVVEAGLMRDGWAVHDGESARARCSVLFSNTIGASMSRDLKPYIGWSGAVGQLWKCDTPDLSDNGTPVQAYVQQPDRHLAGLDHRCQLGMPAVLASAWSGPGEATLAVTQGRDYGAAVLTAAVSRAATGTERRVLRVVESVETADAQSVAITVGDANAVASAWAIDAVVQPFEVREPVVL